MSTLFASVAHTLAQQRIEAIALAVVISLLIFELVRRRRLMERYAILWLIAGATVLVLALWKGLLSTLAHAVGIYYTPSALFAVTFLFVLLMLVHFSITISRLSDQNTVLAQRLALVQQQIEIEPDASNSETAKLADGASDAVEHSATGGTTAINSDEN